MLLWLSGLASAMEGQLQLLGGPSHAHLSWGPAGWLALEKRSLPGPCVQDGYSHGEVDGGGSPGPGSGD